MTYDYDISRYEKMKPSVLGAVLGEIGGFAPAPIRYGKTYNNGSFEPLPEDDRLQEAREALHHCIGENRPIRDDEARAMIDALYPHRVEPSGRNLAKASFVLMGTCLGILLCIALSPDWFKAQPAAYDTTPVHTTPGNDIAETVSHPGGLWSAGSNHYDHLTPYTQTTPFVVQYGREHHEHPGEVHISPEDGAVDNQPKTEER